MELFKNILVYQHADQHASAALRIAAHLSRQGGSLVKVVDIHQEHHGWWQDIFDEKSLSLQNSTSEQLDRLNALVDEADFADESVQVKVLQGRPIDVLINESQSNGCDLILKDAQCETENLFFGSLDMRLMRLAPMPVWLAEPTVPAKVRRVLAAIDPHVADDEMHMNERVIRFASLLARQDDAELYIVSGWYIPSASFEREGDEFKRYQGAEEHVRQRAWETIEHVINTSLIEISPDRVLFEKGPPSDTIVSAVQEQQPDLLVMGTVARCGIPGLLIGNTAEKVTRQVECSVLTLKPKNFSFLLPSPLRV